jgi:Na+-transporting NADH:ubiquinone oxidoreductase subunit F
MSETLFAIFIISLIAAGLATLLIVAERFISNYGDCAIKINDDRQFTIKGGGSLLEALRGEKIFIPSACGGRGTCGYCKVKAFEGAGILLPTEAPFLDDKEKGENVRLSCMVKVRNDLRIEIPAELLSVREYLCRCADIVDLTHDIKQFRFELQEPASIDYIPGQYIQLFVPPYNGNTEEVYRAYSISSDPSRKNFIETVIRLVPDGICTTYCFNHLKQGDAIRLNGPYGEFRLADTEAPVIFIAGGSGIAPIKCLLHQMENAQIDRAAIFFFGANLVKELFYIEEMKHFEKSLKNFQFVPVVAQPEENTNWEGETGLVTEALARRMKNAGNHEAYLCGSPGLIDASISVLKQIGIPEDKIYYDKFA